MSSPEELIVAFEKAAEEYVAFIDTLSEAAFRNRPGPDEWTAAEITGHVAEYPLWLSGLALQLAREPGLRLGRDRNDPARLAAVAGMAGATPTVGAAAVRSTALRAAATLRQIPPEGWDSMGKHLQFGDFTVTDIVQRLMVLHTCGHLDQARGAAGAAGGGLAGGA